MFLFMILDDSVIIDIIPSRLPGTSIQIYLHLFDPECVEGNPDE
jgi:hypothetical protein